MKMAGPPSRSSEPPPYIMKPPQTHTETTPDTHHHRAGFLDPQKPMRDTLCETQKAKRVHTNTHTRTEVQADAVFALPQSPEVIRWRTRRNGRVHPFSTVQFRNPVTYMYFIWIHMNGLVYVYVHECLYTNNTCTTLNFVYEVVIEERSRRSVMSGNPISCVKEWCDRSGCEAVYRFEEAADGWWWCEVVLKGDSVPPCSARGQSKRKAKWEASKALWGLHGPPSAFMPFVE